MKRILTRLGCLLYALIARTWRIRESAPPAEKRKLVREILDGLQPASILFRHGEMFPLWYHLSSTRGVPVVSRSDDGTQLVHLLRVACGYRRFIRGSSSTGGGEVLREMIEQLETRAILLTPDGPRGPEGEAKPGGLVAAHRSGRPVLLVRAESRYAIRLSSWDRMEIPLPFSTVNIRYCIWSINNEEEITASIKRATTLLTYQSYPPASRADRTLNDGGESA